MSVSGSKTLDIPVSIGIPRTVAMTAVGVITGGAGVFLRRPAPVSDREKRLMNTAEMCGVQQPRQTPLIIRLTLASSQSRVC